MSKPTLIILPGWGGSHYTWQEFITLASRHFKVYCIDLPCFGDEPCPDMVWGVEEFAHFVREKLSSIKYQVSSIVLLGHSFGGQVAVQLAAKHPELLDKLVLSGAAVVRPNRVMKRALSQGVASMGRALMALPPLRRHKDSIRKIFYRLIDSPDYLETSGIKREIYKKIIRQDLTALLPQIKVPTLVIWGSKDKMTPLRQGKKVASLLPSVTLKIFPNCGHALHRDAPDEMMKMILDFVG